MDILKRIRKEPKLTVIFLLIFLIAIFFRTYNYYDRIYVYADNALFVQAAYFALDNGKIPQIGPFAQAPFFTGPWWIWIIMVFFLFPFGYLTPWYFMFLLSFVFIAVIYFAGKEIGGRRMGVLSAFLTSISTGQIDNSFMTWNAAADPLLGLLAILFLLKYTKTKKQRYIFLLGFSVSLATAIHFQTFLLSGLILVALLTTKPKLKDILALVLGALIPILPFLYFDLRFNWFETIRIYEYITIGQSKIFVPNRWLTYAGIYWPQTWAWIIGGKTWVGYLIVIIVSIVSLIKLKDFKKNWNYFLISFAFVISVVILRYYRGERFFYYTNYAQGFVILITSWVIYQLYKFKKLIGLMLLAIITVFTIDASINNFDKRVVTNTQVKTMVEEIYNTYPSSNFDIYECPFNGSIISTPVSYKMYHDGRNTLDGIKIGVCSPEFKLSWREITDDEIGREYSYMRKSTPNIYTEMTEWWKTNPPNNTSLYQ